MSIVCIKTYEVECDGCGDHTGGQLDRPVIAKEAEACGWLRRGKKWYCPECRSSHEPKKK